MKTVVTTTLHIVSDSGETDMPLDPAGAIIGRSPDCHVVLDSPRISRRHARIYRDPFGRWIVEDLSSRNGVWIGENRIEVQALSPGETLLIGPYSLSLTEPPAEEIKADHTATATSTIIEEDAGEPFITESADDYDALSGARLKQLNAISDRLAELTNPDELYPEACRSLARTPETVAVVLRIPAGSEPMADGPTVLACHFGGQLVGQTDQTTDNLHISRRVVEAVRTGGKAVMATSTRSGKHDLALTVVDEQRPRAVLCSPVGDATDTIEALYLDIPSTRATGEMLDFVRAVCRQVSLARKSLLLSEVRAQRRALDRQLDLAREIQSNLTPSNVKELKGVETAFCYQPAMWVGGDYCDMWTLADGRLAFVIADVSGKGLAAAMVMSNLQAALRTTMSFCSKVDDAIDHIDRHLSDTIPEQMFVTMFLGIFESQTGELQYVNAGHILPIIVRPDGSVGSLGQPTNPPVGVFVGSFKAEEELIAPDTTVLVVTDGITEAMSPKGEEFGTDRLAKSLSGTTDKSARETVNIATNAASDFREDLPQQDDITVFALRNTKPT